MAERCWFLGLMMGGWRIRFKMLDGTRFDDDEIEVHGGDCLEAFC